MRRFIHVFSIFAALIYASGCQPGGRAELVLPEGDAESGQALFVELQCTACHSVSGVEMPEPASPRKFSHLLGGQRIKTYPELVTSIINPSHRISGRFRGAQSETVEGSPMTVYNDVITITQLVDLVAFLQPLYKIDRPPRYRYVQYEYSE